MNSARTCFFGLLLTLGVWAGAAQASVELVSEVHKVIRYVDDSGVVQRRLTSTDKVVPGDELEYSVRFTNVGGEAVDAGSVLITNPIPEHTEYLEGSAGGDSTRVQFSVDAGRQFAEPEALYVTRNSSEVPADARDYTTIRWHYQPGLAPGETGKVSFNVRLK